MRDTSKRDRAKLRQTSTSVSLEKSSGRCKTGSEACSSVSRCVAQSFEETLRETLCKAIQNGYDGVDISHIEIEGLSTHSKLDVWRVNRWSDEPEQSDQYCRRYDFRYYDRERLHQEIQYRGWPSVFD